MSVLAAGGRWVDDGLTERLFRRANATLEDRKGKRAMTVEENAADNRTQHGAVVAMPPPLPEQQPHLPSYLHLHEVRQCLVTHARYMCTKVEQSLSGCERSSATARRRAALRWSALGAAPRISCETVTRTGEAKKLT